MDSRVTTPRINLVRGDTGPQIQLTLYDAQTGNPLVLTGATAELHFRAVGTTTVLFTRPLTIPGATAAQGLAVIAWGANDLDQPAGDYEGEVEITFSTGMIQTVYDTLPFRIREQFA